jgi:ABC-type nitrate/sulfonate/bicarbonate transport system ATPase subunit
VKNELDIKLSRPRDLRVKRDPQFLTYEDEIWESIQEELAVPAERLIAGMPAA